MEGNSSVNLLHEGSRRIMNELSYLDTYGIQVTVKLTGTWLGAQ